MHKWFWFDATNIRSSIPYSSPTQGGQVDYYKGKWIFQCAWCVERNSETQRKVRSSKAVQLWQPSLVFHFYEGFDTSPLSFSVFKIFDTESLLPSDFLKDNGHALFI